MAKIVQDLKAAQARLWSSRTQAEIDVAQAAAALDMAQRNGAAGVDVAEAAARVEAAKSAFAEAIAGDETYRRLIMLSLFLDQFPGAEELVAEQFAAMRVE